MRDFLSIRRDYYVRELDLKTESLIEYSIYALPPRLGQGLGLHSK